MMMMVCLSCMVVFDGECVCVCSFWIVLICFEMFGSPRTGNLIVAMVAEAEPIHAYMVLTVWPRQQKPKPSPIKVSLSTMKSCRAVRLLPQEGDDPAPLMPTNFVSMLEPHNILAILDAETENSEIHTGKIIITPDSWKVLRTMQSDAFNRPSLPTRKRKPRGDQKNEKNPGKKSGKNDLKKKAAAAVKKIIQKKKIALESKTGKPKGSKDDPSEAMAADQTFVSENFRRSSNGRQAIMEVIKKFMVQDTLKFQSPVFNMKTNLCTLNGFEAVSWKTFLPKCGKFFECKYAFAARSPRQYGDKVFSDLMAIHRQLNGNPPSQVKWVGFVKEVVEIMGTALWMYRLYSPASAAQCLQETSVELAQAPGWNRHVWTNRSKMLQTSPNLFPLFPSVSICFHKFPRFIMIYHILSWFIQI